MRPRWRSYSHFDLQQHYPVSKFRARRDVLVAWDGPLRTDGMGSLRQYSLIALYLIPVVYCRKATKKAVWEISQTAYVLTQKNHPLFVVETGDGWFFATGVLGDGDINLFTTGKEFDGCQIVVFAFFELGRRESRVLSD